jgi:hypothetical protein
MLIGGRRGASQVSPTQSEISRCARNDNMSSLLRLRHKVPVTPGDVKSPLRREARTQIKRCES